MREDKVGDIVYVEYRDPKTGEYVELRMRVVKVGETMVRMVPDPGEEPEQPGE